MNEFPNPQSRSYAQITGVTYLIIAIAGGFAILWVPLQLHVSGDPAGTFANISSRYGLYLAGVTGEVVIIMAEVLATTMLFFMFKQVNPTLAMTAALARLLMAAVMAVMLLFHAAVILIVTERLSVTDAPTAVATLLELHNTGVWIWQVLFTLHLAILGLLVARSGHYPRLLGYAMALGSAGYTCDTLSKILVDAPLLTFVTTPLLILVSFAEIGFALWLVFRGPKESPAR